MSALGLTLARASTQSQGDGSMGSTEQETSELVPVTAEDLISYFRDLVPLLVGGSEGDLYTALSLPENMRLLSK